MTTATQPRFDDLDIEAEPPIATSVLLDYMCTLQSMRDDAINPVIQQAYALRSYQVETVIAVRNAQVMADLDDAAERRTVTRIVEWLRQPSGSHTAWSGLLLDVAAQLERGDWRSR